MKLKRPIKIVLVPIAMFLGWLAMGIGYTIPLSPSINTILFVGGFFVCIGGIIWLRACFGIRFGLMAVFVVT
ncbi:hypothetical protein GCM10028817_46040 [Spirosoma pomorum]